MKPDPSKAVVVPAGKRRDKRVKLPANAPKAATRLWRDRVVAEEDITESTLAGQDALSEAIQAAGPIPAWRN